MECHEIDLADPIFDEGDDERCPMCGKPLALGDARITRSEGVIFVEHKCECGYTVTFSYWIHDVMAER